MIVVREYISHSSSGINALLCFTIVHVASSYSPTNNSSPPLLRVTAPLAVHVTGFIAERWFLYCSSHCAINVLKGNKT